jgi:glycosyltransferase involved in cell wall biosynthesis
MITPLFPPRYSGSTNQALNLAEYLAKDCDISFLALTETDGADAVVKGFPVHYIREKNIEGIISGDSVQSTYFLIGKIFVKLFRMRNSYDLLHCHLTAFPFSTISLFSRLSRKKLVMKNSLFGELDWRKVGRVSGRIHRWSTKNVERFVAISTEVCDNLRAIGYPNEQTRYITNGVDCNRFKPLDKQARTEARNRLGLNPKAQIIVFVGAICERKGVYDLVRQWPAILSALPDALLLLIGPSGKEHNEFLEDRTQDRIDSFVRQWGLNKSIKALGSVSNVQDYLQISDLLVLPSKNEGMPNVLLEAMACGVPCVASRVSGVPDIINSGEDGYIVDDIEKLERTVVQHFLNGNMENMKKRAVRKIHDRFSFDMVAAQYIALYHELLEKSYISRPVKSM